MASRLSDKEYRRRADKLHGEEGVLEIDDDAPVSRNDSGDDGAYVQAWVWVSDEDS